MDYYFDTSALIELFQDPESDILVESIGKNGRLLLSAYNVAEMSQNPKERIRKAQICFAKRVGRNLRPLALPNQLCRYELEAYLARQEQASFSIREDQESIWQALNEPESIGEQARMHVELLLRQQEEWFNDTRQRFRAGMDEARTKRLQSPRTFAAIYRLLKLNYADSAFMHEFFSPLFEKCGYPIHDIGMIKRIFENCESWKFYFGAMGLGLYLYGFPDHGYGISKQAGSIDTQQAAYLACSDVFVTKDKAQFKIMKLLSKCSTIKRRVLRYSTLRMELVDRACI